MRLLRPASPFLVLSLAICAATASGVAPAPSTYRAYTGMDAKPVPPAPALGGANSSFRDPTFGSRLLRVTDGQTAGGASFISEDAGYFRTWNADGTALKLKTSDGHSYWVEFDAKHFRVGDGSSRPTLHPLAVAHTWEWSAVDPDVLYFLSPDGIGSYNIATQATAILGRPPTREAPAYHVAVVGRDEWVCAAAGSGPQNFYTKIFCMKPKKPAQVKFIDVVNRTINGAAPPDGPWPASAPSQTLGIHSLYGSAGGTWLGLVFHRNGWGAHGEAVFNLSSDTWSLHTSANSHWAGHSSIGNGQYVNGCGSVNGVDSRGAILRDADDLMNAARFSFIMQPPTTVGWYDGEHSSWFNASTNPHAPVLFSRYPTKAPPSPLTWHAEIIAVATDGSNTVWRFAHNHSGGGFYGTAFAQISNDGRWALFSSYWDGTLGASKGDFGLQTRIDTFIVELDAPSDAAD